MHPGGPYWARRDDGAWSIPKGEVEDGEDSRDCAAREFAEELGLSVPPGPWVDLGEVVQRAGKRVRAWAVAGDLPVDRISGGTFELEWPPRSGRWASFPEVDRAVWMTTALARVKLVAAQATFVDRLEALLTVSPDTVAASPETVGASPETVAASSDTDASPGHVRTSPDHVAASPTRRRRPVT